jgi:hypothetical protein
MPAVVREINEKNIVVDFGGKFNAFLKRDGNVKRCVSKHATISQQSFASDLRVGSVVEIMVEDTEQAAHFLGDPKATSVHRASASFRSMWPCSMTIEVTSQEFCLGIPVHRAQFTVLWLGQHHRRPKQLQARIRPQPSPPKQIMCRTRV